MKTVTFTEEEFHALCTVHAYLFWDEHWSHLENPFEQHIFRKLKLVDGLTNEMCCQDRAREVVVKDDDDEYELVRWTAVHWGIRDKKTGNLTTKRDGEVFEEMLCHLGWYHRVFSRHKW
jgi:hypothetical protein